MIITKTLPKQDAYSSIINLPYVRTSTKHKFNSVICFNQLRTWTSIQT